MGASFTVLWIWELLLRTICGLLYIHLIMVNNGRHVESVVLLNWTKMRWPARFIIKVLKHVFKKCKIRCISMPHWYVPLSKLKLLFPIQTATVEICFVFFVLNIRYCLWYLGLMWILFAMLCPNSTLPVNVSVSYSEKCLWINLLLGVMFKVPCGIFVHCFYECILFCWACMKVHIYIQEHMDSAVYTLQFYTIPLIESWRQ